MSSSSSFPPLLGTQIIQGLKARDQEQAFLYHFPVHPPLPLPLSLPTQLTQTGSIARNAIVVPSGSCSDEGETLSIYEGFADRYMKV